jgi:hypothetical protein
MEFPVVFILNFARFPTLWTHSSEQTLPDYEYAVRLEKVWTEPGKAQRILVNSEV